MAKTLTAKMLLARYVRRSDRVLLVNPPVHDARYAWIHWNQPLDLLKIGPFLKKEIGCTVALLDFMKPEKGGDVPQQRLPGDRQSRTIGEGQFAERYPTWRFGHDYEEIPKWIAAQKTREHPTQVWITSLCSYWFQSIAQVCVRLRQHFRDVQIVLIGNYPRMIPDHAVEQCPADLAVTRPLPIDGIPMDLGLYGKACPPFAAIMPHTKCAVAEVRAAVSRGVTDFAFFSEDLLSDGGQALWEIVRKTEHLHRHIKYHVICGLYPQLITPKTAKILAHKRFADLHFEETSTNYAVDVPVYEAAITYLREAGLTIPSRAVSGFVWIGRPRETLETIIQNMIALLRALGTFILKPFTPTPGSPEHSQNADYLARIPSHEDWSPHLFPFAELNGIARADYHDLYRLAAFLNDKVRGQSFDFLAGTLGLDFLKSSLQREVWRIGSTALRTTD